MALSLIDQTLVKAYDPKPTDKAATSLNLKIELLLPPKERFEVDDVELLKSFKKQYNKYYVSLDQVFVMNFNNTPYIITVDRLVGSKDAFVFIS